MITASRHELIEKLAEVHQLSPDIRFGQLLANLGFLVEDQTDQSLRDVEEDRLLEVMEMHRLDLARRQADAGSTRPPTPTTARAFSSSRAALRSPSRGSWSFAPSPNFS